MYKFNKGWSFFVLLIVAGFIMPFVISCGKSTTVSPSALNIKFQVINLSPNAGSVDLYINYKKVNNASYFYPASSGYFYLTTIDTPFQIRNGTSVTVGSIVPSANILPNFNFHLKPNLRYTLMVTGLAPDSLGSIFTTDTSSLPALGRSKIRFINASPHSTGFDITANGTPILPFANLPYSKVSNFVELPAGTYDFQVFPHGTATLIKDIPNISLQDGRLYTLYCYGFAGRTDTLAFGSGVITNK